MSVSPNSASVVPRILTREDYVASRSPGGARFFLGKYLCVQSPEGYVEGVIIETEAYGGALDKACHAFGNKRTPRTEMLFASGGLAYVYLCYVLRSWFEKCEQSLSKRQHEWVESIIGVWRGKPVPGEIKTLVSRYLVNRFGEPQEGGPLWEFCSQEVRETVIQWLLYENMEMFFDLIADYAEKTGGEIRDQWAYRRSFWLAVYRTGAVSDIRIGAGRGFVRSLGQDRLKDYFGSKLWILNGNDERRCAMIMKLEKLTIVDFTHNAKCRVWRTSEGQSEWFDSAGITHFNFKRGTDVKIRAQYNETGLTHFNSDSYGWQGVMTDFLRPHLPVPLLRADFEYRRT